MILYYILMTEQLNFDSDLFKDHKFTLPKRLANVTFLLGYHRSEYDFPLTLRSLHEESDLVLHEQIAWDDRYVATLGAIAAGDCDISLYEHPINKRKADLIRETSAVQRSWDVPAAHLSAQEHLRYFGSEVRQYTHGALEDPDFSSKFFEKYFQMIHKRDKIGLRNIRREIDSLDTFKDVPKVLVVAGLSHVGMANAYRSMVEDIGHESEVKIETTFPDLPIDAMTGYIIDKYTNKVDLDVRSKQLIDSGSVTTQPDTPSHLNIATVA